MANNDVKVKAVITAEDKASAAMRSFGDSVDSVSDKIAHVAKVATVAFGAATTAAVGFSVKSFADYEQSLNIFQAVSGATAEEMKQVGTVAKQLGKDITLPGISAKDAALAMTELAKAGLSVEDSLAAAKGVLSLAKAGQLDTAQAAEIAANALNAFSLKGTEAVRVADLLAAAANASSASVSDIAIGMQMSSAAAAGMKVPVQDLVTLLAEMSNNGVKGSDAGTSLKTMFMSLTPTTKKAREEMQKLNLDFFDAQGKFVGVRSAIDQLQKATSKLTDEQKSTALQTIFGTDAFRAANIMVKEGVTGYDKLSTAVNKQGAATELAAAQNKGLKGALDNLKSTAETLAIDVGEKLAPYIQKFARTLSDNSGTVSNFALNIIDASIRAGSALKGLADQAAQYLSPKFDALWNTISNKFIPAVANLVKAIGPTVGAGLVGAIGLAADALNVFLTLATPVFNFLSDHTWIIWSVVTAFLAIKAALFIEKAVNAFVVSMALVEGAMIQTGSAAGALKAALVAVAGPWQIALGIIGVAAVIAAIKEVSDALDSLLTKWSNTNNKVKVNGSITVNGGSETGLVQQLRNAFGGFRAGGGPVMPNKNYIVGENGPELFSPSTNGTIIPNAKVNPSYAGAGKSDNLIQRQDPPINITIQTQAFMGSQQDARKFAVYIQKALEDAQAAKGMAT